jgi:hypothetical protein
MRAVGCAAVAIAVLCVLAALAGGSGGTAPSALAGVLPAHFRLVLTEVSEHGRLHIVDYGRPSGEDPYDAPLRVESFRGSTPPPYENDPEVHPGEHPSTVRGHPAVLRTLTDEDQAYARELVWRERPDLTVAVSADLALGKRELRRVAEHVRTIGPSAWARLYLQTSGGAQIGHVSRTMRRVAVEHGVAEETRWRLFALIPPRFPLSSNDLRVSCFELRHNGRRGHGDDCGVIANWQRIGGTVFVFGATRRSVRHLVIRPYSGGRAFTVSTRTVAPRRGPRVRYFATALPSTACAVVITRANHPHEDGDIAAPIHGRDQRRCAARAGG